MSPSPPARLSGRQGVRYKGEVELRGARSEDIPALVRLLEILFSQEDEFTPDAALQERGLRAILSDPQLGEIVVAEEEGRLVGMVSLLYTVSTALGSRVALLEDTVVDPSRRGAGVGSRLLEEALQVCRRRGCSRITLLSDARNTKAHRFYRRFGFVGSAMIPLRRFL